MGFNLRNHSLLALKDFAPRDVRFLLDLAKELKRSKYAGNEIPRLRGKNIVLIFEKASTRTRCSFEVAVHDQGGHVTYIDSGGSQLGHKESLKDIPPGCWAVCTTALIPRLPSKRRRGPHPLFSRAGVERPDR